MAKEPDIQVLIPYKQLCELLKAPEEVDRLRKDLDKLNKKHDALRTQFIELMDAFGELKRFVSD